MFLFRMRGTVRICQCGNRFPMGRYFKGTEKFRRSSAGCVGKTGNTGSRGNPLAHFETSQLQYNDENALSYTISLALYAARNFYTVYRELPGGKGFADLVFVPRKRYQDKPALVVELKWDKTAEGALAQIKDKEYCRSLEEYQGNLLLVGINYNKKTKEHVCRIEEYQK